MEYRNLKTFLQVVESGSISKAAELLGYTQSAVSLQIQALEKELDCKLFDRINHTISLTDSGRKLLSHALNVRQVMDDLTDAFHSTDVPRGQIRLISSDSICEKMMLLHYNEFYQTYPEIKLVFSTSGTDTMLAALAHNEADIVFTLDTHVYSPEYVVIKESPVSLHFVTSPDSPLAHRKGLHLQDLLEYPFVLTEKGMSYRNVMDQKFGEYALAVNPVLETGRTDILARCVEQGNYISFLPDFVTEEKVRDGKLVRLDVADFEPIIWKQLICHKNKWISRPLECFIDFVVSHEFEW